MADFLNDKYYHKLKLPPPKDKSKEEFSIEEMAYIVAALGVFQVKLTDENTKLKIAHLTLKVAKMINHTPEDSV